MKMKLNYIIILVFNLDLIITLDNPLHINQYSECVSGALSNHETECYEFSVIDKYCCYLSPIDKTEKGLCLLLNKNDFNGRNTINYNQTSYNIKCGFGSANARFNTPVGSNYTCFMNNPPSYQECHNNSTEYNSCCYYMYEGISGCYWLGTSYEGSTINNEITLICSNSFLKFSHFVFFLIYNVFYIYLP